MELIQAILNRHSYRGMYLPDPVPREHLQKILEAGLAAPSGCNLQSVHLVAVEDPALMGEIRRRRPRIPRPGLRRGH